MYNSPAQGIDLRYPFSYHHSEKEASGLRLFHGLNGVQKVGSTNLVSKIIVKPIKQPSPARVPALKSPIVC